MSVTLMEWNLIRLVIKRKHEHESVHPSTVKPSRAGHSIGRWEKDVLIVDTVGFAPGVLSPSPH